MGVKTKISLGEINNIFSSYSFTTLIPTSSGIIDTTYIISSKENDFILKKYERDISKKIQEDKKLLKELNSFNLNVPLCLEDNGEWFLYKKLKGVEPKQIKTYHIQALGRFLASLHSYTYKKACDSTFIENYEVLKLLNQTKREFYYYYNKLAFLKDFKSKNDGLIHGDIFKDNTVFDGNKIGVFDFIDSACGDFTFECGVALIGFDKRKNNPLFIKLFLNAYNQHAPKKIKKDELLKQMDFACGFYALLRIDTFKNTKKAKELL